MLTFFKFRDIIFRQFNIHERHTLCLARKSDYGTCIVNLSANANARRVFLCVKKEN